MVKRKICCNPLGKKKHKNIGKKLRLISQDWHKTFDKFSGMFICNSCCRAMYKKKEDDETSEPESIASVFFSEIEEEQSQIDISNIFIRNVQQALQNASQLTEKVKILTTLPSSWTQYKMCKVFGVSRRLARRAKQIKKKFGFASMPKKKICHRLAASVELEVKQFYLLDDISRIMPGRKDFVSIKTLNGRVHKQKRLLLFNLKDIFEQFKLQFPNIKISLSKFKSLRPRQCVYAGQSGTHSVCVCKLHQNVDLKIFAAQKALRKKGFVLDEKAEDFLSSCVCVNTSPQCYLLQCQNCPGFVVPEKTLMQLFTQYGINDVTFSVWCSTDR